MKSWVVIGGAAVLGAFIGLAGTAFEMWRSRESFEPSALTQLDSGNGPKAGGDELSGKGKAKVLGDTDFDFGSMEHFSTRRHTFRVKNVGDGVLTLTPGRTTCKCTLSKISANAFVPGEVAKITLEWTGKTLSPEPEFAQTAEIHTNDPDQPILELNIHGLVTETVRTLPAVLQLRRVSSNSGTTTHFRLFAFRSDTIKVLKVSYANRKLAPFLDLKFDPLPRKEVEQEKGASCGLLATLTIKSGLPLGPIEQTIHIKVNVDKEVAIDIPMRGTVASDIIIASTPYFYSSQSLLNLGALKSSDTTKTTLHMFVKGEYRRDVKFEVEKMDPPGYFKVDISPPTELNKGKTLKYDLTIEVPPGLEPVNRLGSAQAKYGCITLKTTHPQTKEVPIYVKFAVK